MCFNASGFGWLASPRYISALQATHKSPQPTIFREAQLHKKQNNNVDISNQLSIMDNIFYKMNNVANIHEVQQAYETLKNGGTILYPTDTIWGIGCDATKADAVDKIYAIKQRSDTKSLIILVDSYAMLNQYVQQVPEIAYNLIELADKPLTIIYSDAKNLPQNLISSDGTIGIRLVKHPFCCALIAKLRKPIVSTSANISGQASPQSYQSINTQIIESVDYAVNLERTAKNSGKPSAIIKLANDGVFTIIRK